MEAKQLREKKSLTKKESNKLFYSEHLKKSDAMWLYNLLKVDTPLAFEKVPIEKEKLFLNIIDDLLLRSADEWVQTTGPKGQQIEDRGEDRSKWKQCSLCNTPNRYIHYIKNTLNKQKLNVGSDCISEFGSIASNAKKSRKILEKNALRQKRMQEIIGIIPGIRTSVEKWDLFIKELPIFLSDKEIMYYNEIGAQVQEIFEKILNQGIKEKLVYKLREKIEEGQKEKENILVKLKSIKKLDFVLTSNQINWIKAHQPDKFQQIATFIKNSEDSQISLSCASLIAEPDFLKIFMRKYNELAEKENKEIIELYNDWRRRSTDPLKIHFEKELPKIIEIKPNSFIFEFNSLPQIQFTLSSTKFIQQLGFLIFPSAKVALDNGDVMNLLIDSSLNSINSYDAFCSQLELTINKTESDYRFNVLKVNSNRDYADFRVFISSNTDNDGNIHSSYMYQRYVFSRMYDTLKCVLLKKNGLSILTFLENEYIKSFNEKEYEADQREEIELLRMNN